MKQIASISAATQLMIQFAGQTGLLPAEESPGRYLWTDAFAVCNFLGLYCQTHENEYRDLALRLVDQVHTSLGRHRADDSRKGWISGLAEEEGRMHPTRGGLRIGKALNERKPGDAFDEGLEWDRDGQYFHYLTKWMHALNRVSRVTGDFTYNRWAMELAKAVHPRFVFPDLSSGGQKRMYWKMSVDLSYPLVLSMGHHDPLDGFITYSQLQAVGKNDPARPARLDLDREVADMSAICEGKSWATDDPLGIGGLLCDAYRTAQLIAGHSIDRDDLPASLLDASLSGLKAYSMQNSLKLPAQYRLAFRELGLSIGLHSIENLRVLIEGNGKSLHRKDRLGLLINRLSKYAPLSSAIETFWLHPSNRQTETWVAHRDINMVMLATSIAPDGFLGL